MVHKKLYLLNDACQVHFSPVIFGKVVMQKKNSTKMCCKKKNLNIRKYVMTIFNEAPQNLVIEIT